MLFRSLIPMQMGKTEPQEIKLTEDQDNEAFLDDFAVEDDMPVMFRTDDGMITVVFQATGIPIII